MNTPLREAIQREIRLRKARLAANASEKPLDRILPWPPMQGPKGKALDSVAATLDEGVRFPTCAPAPLEALFAHSATSKTTGRHFLVDRVRRARVRRVLARGPAHRAARAHPPHPADRSRRLNSTHRTRLGSAGNEAGGPD